MAFVLADRVKESTTTTGTGTINLGGAFTQFRTFVAGVGNGNQTCYCIISGNGTDWEVGLGTVTDATPDTLSRTTIFSSSNSGSAINLSGTSIVFCDDPARKISLTLVTGADANLVLDKGSALATYNLVSLNGDLTLAGAVGLLGGATADPSLNYLAKTGGSHKFFVNGFNLGTLAADGFTLDNGGTNLLKISAGTTLTTYNIITFNGVKTSTGMLGLIAGGVADAFLYSFSPSGGGFRVAVNAATVTEFNASGSNIQGTTTNDDAGAGKVGEYLEATGTISITSGGFFNITSKQLNAGDWEVNGSISTAVGSGGIINQFFGAVNDVSASFPGAAYDYCEYYGNGLANYNVGGPVPTRRFTVANGATKIIYLVTTTSFSGTSSMTGKIQARRMR